MLAPATVLAAKVGFLKISALRCAQFLAVHLRKAGNESPSSQECGHHAHICIYTVPHPPLKTLSPQTPQLLIMRKQTNHPIQAHLIRCAFYLLLLLPVCVSPFALAQRNATKPKRGQVRQREQSVSEISHALPANIIVVTNTNDSGPGS